jgi:hypothetical protein
MAVQAGLGWGEGWLRTNVYAACSGGVVCLSLMTGNEHLMSRSGAQQVCTLDLLSCLLTKFCGASQHAVRPTCRKVERGVRNVSGSALAVAPRTKIDVGRRRATAGGPPCDTTARAGYCLSPQRPPGHWSWATAPPLGKLEPLYQTCCPPFRRPPGADPGARGPPPRPSVPARADPSAASWDRPRSTYPPTFDRGKRPRSGRGRRSRADRTISGLAVGHCD